MGRKLVAWARRIVIGGPILVASALSLPSVEAQTIITEDGQTTVTIHYDLNGNRKSETLGAVTFSASPISIKLSATTVTATVSTTGGTAPYTATSHISATPTGGTPPYLYQWSPFPTSSTTGANFTLANSGCASGVLCGAGTASSSDTAILSSSCNSQTCTNSATWNVDVSDQAGNATSAQVTITHKFAP